MIAASPEGVGAGSTASGVGELIVEIETRNAEAGASLKRTPAKSETASVKSRTRASMAMEAKRGTERAPR